MNKLLDLLFPARGRHRAAEALAQKLTVQLVICLNLMDEHQKEWLYQFLHDEHREQGYADIDLSGDKAGLVSHINLAGYGPVQGYAIKACPVKLECPNLTQVVSSHSWPNGLDPRTIPDEGSICP